MLVMFTDPLYVPASVAVNEYVTVDLPLEIVGAVFVVVRSKLVELFDTLIVAGHMIVSLALALLFHVAVNVTVSSVPAVAVFVEGVVIVIGRPEATTVTSNVVAIVVSPV